MKDFPRFTQSNIEYSITQPQMKLLSAIVADFINRLDTNPSPQQINALNAIAKQQACGLLPVTYSENPQQLVIDSHLLIDALIDAYVDKKSKYQDRVLDDLNALFAESYDREIFDLSDGETLKIADSSSVYG